MGSGVTVPAPLPEQPGMIIIEINKDIERYVARNITASNIRALNFRN
jgi:hypothetical protein